MVKPLSRDPDSENSLLVPLESIPTTIHHPEKVGLYPGHSGEGETVTSKPARRRRRRRRRMRKEEEEEEEEGEGEEV